MGTPTGDLGPVELEFEALAGARANAEARRRAAAGTPIVGGSTGEGSVGRAIITHRQEILESGPALNATINEILDWYDQHRPNDSYTQQFVGQLERLSTQLDTYLAIVRTEPSENDAEAAGKNLFQTVLSAIKAFEKTTTGDKIVRLAACGTLLGLAAIAAPMLSPYLTVPLMTACVFPKETKVATGLFKEVEGIARKVGVLPSKSDDQ